ncbi:MAG: M23 family metallopeptidase [Syntrophotalea acetylenica]|nr:M23 family metallopeptidase [Syntrophotalea acetylenica]
MKNHAIMIILLLVVGTAAGYFMLRDSQAPDLTLTPESGAVSAKKPPVLKIQDDGAGLKSLKVSVSQDGKTAELISKTWQGGVSVEEIPLPLDKLPLKNGPLRLTVQVSDSATLANRAERSFELAIDTKPPVISVLTTAHNVYEGGAGLTMFRVNEDVKYAGVKVAERFFPAYRQDNGVYACLFAWPHNVQRGAFTPRVVVEDPAGNQRTAGIYYNPIARPPHADRINISQAFLDSKMPDFQHYFPDTTDPLQLFLRINRELRAKNVARLNELAAKTADRPLWEGAFLRLPNAAPRADFNDRRDYLFNGQKVDSQTHLGIDLASLAASPIPASNSGTVVLAEDFGIYGQCIIIDHGLGLQSLYSHLSSIDVAVGDQISKGQVIGRTGATGMAGGDHLHFGIVLSGLEINPREWLDGHWIKDNFTGKWDQVMAQP